MTISFFHICPVCDRRFFTHGKGAPCHCPECGTLADPQPTIPIVGERKMPEPETFGETLGLALARDIQPAQKPRFGRKR